MNIASTLAISIDDYWVETVLRGLVGLVAVLLPVAWWYLVRRFARGGGLAGVELPRFGPLPARQRWVLCVFCVTAALWITRGDFGALRGWGSRLAEHGVRCTGEQAAGSGEQESARHPASIPQLIAPHRPHARARHAW